MRKGIREKETSVLYTSTRIYIWRTTINVRNAKYWTFVLNSNFVAQPSLWNNINTTYIIMQFAKIYLVTTPVGCFEDMLVCFWH